MQTHKWHEHAVHSPRGPGSGENAQLSPHQFLQTFSRLLSSCFLLFHDRTSLEGGKRKKHKAHDSFYTVYPRKPMRLQKEGRGASPQGTVSTCSGARLLKPRRPPLWALCAPRGEGRSPRLLLRLSATENGAFPHEPPQAGGLSPMSCTYQPEAPSATGSSSSLPHFWL